MIGLSLSMLKPSLQLPESSARDGGCHISNITSWSTKLSERLSCIGPGSESSITSGKSSNLQQNANRITLKRGRNNANALASLSYVIHIWIKMKILAHFKLQSDLWKNSQMV
jgi:hypothetical protein